MFVGCGRKTSELKDYINETIKIQEEYGASIEKAKNGKDIEDAIDKYGDSMVVLSKKAKELESKYPELKTQKEFPELKTEYDKLKEISEKTEKSVAIVMTKYISNKAVIKSMQELTKKLIEFEEKPADKK